MRIVLRVIAWAALPRQILRMVMNMILSFYEAPPRMVFRVARRMVLRLILRMAPRCI